MSHLAIGLAIIKVSSPERGSTRNTMRSNNSEKARGRKLWSPSLTAFPDKTLQQRMQAMLLPLYYNHKISVRAVEIEKL